jgi:thymidylate synthase (methanogen type)
MRDRIAYPQANELIVTNANVGITVLWTIRDSVIPYLDKNNLAIVANFYTPAGLGAMIRNILSNPFIRYVIMFGEEYSSKSAGDKVSDRTSANMLRTFFEKGINKDRKLEGFENSVYIDKNIPLEYIELVRSNVELIDLNSKMPNATMQQKIEQANKLLGTLQKKQPFLDKPLIFDYEQATDSFPYEGGALIVHGNNIPDAWIKMIYNIYRYGRKNLMNANTDRWVKEINNMVVVIHNPQDMDLTINPFLIPLTKEKIEAYKREILSPILPEGKAYTYGNKLRAYFCYSSKEIKDLVNSVDYKDFEFKKGPWLDKNVIYKKMNAGGDDASIDATGNSSYCEIDQLSDIIDVLKRDPYSKACVAMTWHPADELMRKHKSSPCLVMIQAMVQDERLNLTVYFRSHDMTQGWPENAYGCAAIQNEIAKAINMESGILSIISDSAQIYNNYYQQVEDMLKKYHKNTGMCHDKRGNYLIKLEDNKIIVTLMHPETSVVLEEFHGKSADELRDMIAHSALLETGHAIYIGSELARAENALKNRKQFQQDMHE